ncbi:MAG: hypothetical protein HON76_11125 [Candidatus Scalindua sp.]|nr:hypothetical protein [Candidatus Scalindua sp.]
MKSIIVAEAASNHNGDLGIAKEMIHAAKEAGADMIKFQSYLGRNVKEGHADKDRFEKVNLSDEAHFELLEESNKKEIGFFTTCFDIGRIEFLKTLRITTVKVASYDMDSRQMVGELARSFQHLIISTGSSDNENVKETVDLLNGTECQYTLLHCTTLYPTLLERANLSRLDWLKQFTPNVGFSDHTIGTEAPKAAIAMGAVMVEKHFTLDKNMKGNSHKLACDPKELKEITEYAQLFEKMYGSDRDVFGEDELKIRNFYKGLLGEGI